VRAGRSGAAPRRAGPAGLGPIAPVAAAHSPPTAVAAASVAAAAAAIAWGRRLLRARPGDGAPRRSPRAAWPRRSEDACWLASVSSTIRRTSIAGARLPAARAAAERAAPGVPLVVSTARGARRRRPRPAAARRWQRSDCQRVVPDRRAARAARIPAGAIAVVLTVAPALAWSSPGPARSSAGTAALDHGAAIARELGVPCVVGCLPPEALRTASWSRSAATRAGCGGWLFHRCARLEVARRQAPRDLGAMLLRGGGISLVVVPGLARRRRPGRRRWAGCPPAS
jgi:hypothetical protein